MRIRKEDKAGLYLTVIVHLAVVIILLATSLSNQIQKEHSFVLDFSKVEEIEKMQAEIERLQKEAAFKESIAQKLQAEIGSSSPSEIRNVAVDRGALKDDRGTDAEQLYKDAERLANDLKNGHKDAIEENAVEETVEMQHQQKREDKNQKEYSGPSVLSYSLDGRKASHLPIPAYRCYGAGDVTVIITVNNAGQVVRANVMDEISSSDDCLRKFAVRAARMSRFSASSDAPANQTGEIIYRFIAQ